MQISSKKHLLLSLVLLSFLGGCKKNQKKSDSKKDSHYSKIQKHKNGSHVAQPFDLDQEEMATFALDDKLTKRQTSSQKEKIDGKIFSWEEAPIEESKRQFKTLYFDFDKDIMKPNQEHHLKHNVDQAKKMINKGKVIVIEGHACSSAGSPSYNLALSEKRARNIAQKFAEDVAQKLINAGIDSSKIKIAPRGQEMPVRKGGNKKEQAINRRVEIYAIDAE